MAVVPATWHVPRLVETAFYLLLGSSSDWSPRQMEQDEFYFENQKFNGTWLAGMSSCHIPWVLGCWAVHQDLMISAQFIPPVLRRILRFGKFCYSESPSNVWMAFLKVACFLGGGSWRWSVGPRCFLVQPSLYAKRTVFPLPFLYFSFLRVNCYLVFFLLLVFLLCRLPPLP